MKKRCYEFEKEQIVIMENKMEEVGPDNENYRYYKQLRDEFYNTIEESTRNKNIKMNLDSSIKVLELFLKGAGICGSLVMTYYLANLAYDNKLEFKMKDGTIWGLIRNLQLKL